MKRSREKSNTFEAAFVKGYGAPQQSPTVGGSNETQRRARPRARRLQIKRSAQDRAFLEKLRRTEQAAEGHTSSIRDVDVEILRQSSGKPFAKKSEADFRKRQAGIARRFWPRVGGTRCLNVLATVRLQGRITAPSANQISSSS
jgi:hypothetical protein